MKAAVCAERRDLRQREVDEDHFARQDLDAEIGVDADEAYGNEKWQPEEGERVAHRAAAASASMLVSNSAM
ncbi:MAG: hypothetical protein WDO17_15715 [Alphaproteobacteria bacterium]